jgi:transcription elongation factor SPT6
MIVDDSLASNFKSSRRATTLLPTLPQDAAAAVCLARMALEPLAEYANIWRTAGPNELFGHEAIFLSLHPLQALLTGNPSKLVRALECKLVDAVADAGVDIRKCIRHDNLHGLLAFVPGLGLRKADMLRRKLTILESMTGSNNANNNNGERVKFMLQNRKALLANELLGSCVYNNAAGFLRIVPPSSASTSFTSSSLSFYSLSGNRQWNALDNTRIHPECYDDHDFVYFICSSALECNNDPEKAQSNLVAVVQKVRKEFLKRMSKDDHLLELWEHGRPDLTRCVQQEDYSVTVVDKGLNDTLSTLDMIDYNATLLEQGQPNRKLQLEQIKEELRFPCLDLRASLTAVAAEKLFALISGETDQSLYVGRKIGFTVLKYAESNGGGHMDGLPRSAVVQTENGLRGSISKFEVLDDQFLPADFDLSQHLPVGMQGSAVVVGIRKGNQRTTTAASILFSFHYFYSNLLLLLFWFLLIEFILF